jgi:two-component system, NarL family, nitrate/nitrite response regulator NarL
MHGQIPQRAAAMIAAVLYAASGARPRIVLPAEVALVGTADGPAALVRLLGKVAADVVVAELPAGASANQWLAAAHGVAIVALVDDGAEDAALDALCAGAKAVMPRSAGDAEIAAAIIAVAHGLSLLPQPLLQSLLDARDTASTNGEREERLTPRELEVLSALADGASNKVIARRLGISFHTAKFHVASILAKLDADSRTEAVAQAARLGLVML